MVNAVCLFTVVYPGCEPYLDRFIQSVEDQDYNEFELMVLNDGLKDFAHFAGKTETPVREVAVNGSIAVIREQGITMLADSSFEKIIFSDADDYIAENRIEVAVRELEHCDIYINDLTTVNSSGEILTKNCFSERFGNRFEVTSGFILKKNLLGLGNSAVRKSALREIRIPDDTIAVDWLLFTDMLLRGKRAMFSSDTVSYYRQHEENTAGFKKLTPARLMHTLNVQIQNASYFAEQSESHREWHRELLKLNSIISQSGFDPDQLINDIESMLPQHPLWWEEIQYLNEITQNS